MPEDCLNGSRNEINDKADLARLEELFGETSNLPDFGRIETAGKTVQAADFKERVQDIGLWDDTFGGDGDLCNGDFYNLIL